MERGFAGFGHTWSYQRLGKVLLQLGKEHGVEAPGGMMIPLRLTHKDLAELIGTTTRDGHDADQQVQAVGPVEA